MSKAGWSTIDQSVTDGVIQKSVEKLLVEHAPDENQFVKVRGDGEVLGLAYKATGFVENAVHFNVGH
ncbi:unnamed protein product [Didymodactylos carnosus]|uniref:Uncharacterized protein n=1 Tax=Didymodactylos carnosus TaxID=1234261 RepID=A0A8S2QLI0_9BILA|nr:unnamed protein product [Didymodactylos carnosus]CAF4112830.1 unnamed protein product [Didymodactylos carnosus]